MNYRIVKKAEDYLKPSELKVGQLAKIITTESSPHNGCLMLGTTLGPVNISYPNAHEIIGDHLNLLLLKKDEKFIITAI